MAMPIDLIDRLKTGESAAFNEAYRLFHGRLYSYLRRLTGEAALADDLFQETWMKLARHGRDLSDDTNLEAWLFTVARNGFFDHRRWRMFTIKRMRAMFELQRPLSAKHDAATLGLEGALAQLASADRELLLLIAETELELEGVAQVMQISYATLRQRLGRARSRLAAVLNDDGVARS